MLFKQYYVYIMASHSRVLYIGVTSNLGLRVEQHRACTDSNAFCTQYRVWNLVYFEEYQTAAQAIAREKQMKRLLRAPRRLL
jgi:putative endonuclease